LDFNKLLAATRNFCPTVKWNDSAPFMQSRDNVAHSDSTPAQELPPFNAEQTLHEALLNADITSIHEPSTPDSHYSRANALSVSANNDEKERVRQKKRERKRE